MSVILLILFDFNFTFSNVCFLKFANILAKRYVDSFHRANNCAVYACRNKLAKLLLGMRN